MCSSDLDKGTETVHFLNMVDEADLLKLMEDEEVESYMNSQGMTATEKETVEPENITEETTEEQKEEAEVTETEKKPANVTGIMAVVLILVVGGIGGFMYVKSNKEKKKAEGPDPDADYFDEDDEDYLADMDIEEETEADDSEDEDISPDEPDEE